MPHSTAWNDFGNTRPQKTLDTPAANPLGIDTGLLKLRTEALEKSEYPDACAYIAAIFVNATLPHSAQSAGTERVLQNGTEVTCMVNPKGLPYGSYARLILMYLTKAALRQASDFGLTSDLKESDPKEYLFRLEKARQVPVAPTISALMREIFAGSTRSSGPARVNLRTQLLKLLTTTVYVCDSSDFRRVSLDDYDIAPIANKIRLWWERTADGPVLSDEYPNLIKFSPEFFEQMIFHAVPVDPAHVAYLKRSPLALDLYFWATYRLSYAQGSVRITWSQLRGQFGVGYPETPRGNRNFRSEARKAMAKIGEIWPTVGLSEWQNGVKLSGEPAITQVHKNSNPERNRTRPLGCGHLG